MRTNISALILIAFAIIFPFTLNAQNHHDHSSHDHSSGSNSTEYFDEIDHADQDKSIFQQSNKDFQVQLSLIFQRYLNLKEAFVQSDPNLVWDLANLFKDELAKTDMNILEGSGQLDWEAQVRDMDESVTEMLGAETLEQQRLSLPLLSYALYYAIKQFGVSGKDAYYQFCPMALDNDGAFWISDESNIRNPYFGESMLSCGKVDDKVPALME